MKTDRELLELAAKAAGVDLFVYGNEGHEGFQDQTAGRPWNPLTDDGDALRLAVKLRIVIDITPWAADAHHWYESRSNDFGIRHSDFKDSGEATRLAIVRAAAAIGRGRSWQLNNAR